MSNPNTEQSAPARKADNYLEAERQEIERRFTYHPPKGDQGAEYGLIRDGAKALAFQLVALCPDSRERALALTHLEETVMWANASIARRSSDG